RTTTRASYPLSLHDALPIWLCQLYQINQNRRNTPGIPETPLLRPVIDRGEGSERVQERMHRIQLLGRMRQALHDVGGALGRVAVDRKSTRLNSSHVKISYAV